MAPTRSQTTPGMTRSVLPNNAAQRRGVRPTQISTGSLRALIAAASVAVTMGGWSALAFGDAQVQAQAQAQATQDAQAQYDASVLAAQQSSQSVTFPEIPAVPTLLPAPGNNASQAAVPQQPASTPTPQKAAPVQQQPALRSVTLPNPSAQRPAPITRSRSSR
jgi:hypothetical protein